ncbi:Uncharacterized protein PECH_004190 [Penicillium ucsense]|uniref:MOSC domain-containing protein n=1 Tax=Penicillium ucsense TaxID=2839758 RepID=A0A8J8WAA3_9EURO|nr:Uncharacterized protein PECM_005597 [Penicillium ucsense]KAF7737271.1 Uncharacterized protein PECH_004190 [Penicillium ucsense]
MADQYDSQYALASSSPSVGPPRIKSIFLHPVKSCGPVEVDRARVTKTGLLYDRCMAIATRTVGSKDPAAAQWRFISQRTKPCMSQIRTELWLPHRSSDPSDPLVQSEGCLVLSFENPDRTSWTDQLETVIYARDFAARPRVSFIVPLNVPNGELTAFGIHSRQAKGVDLGQIPSIAAALPSLKKFLGLSANQSLTIFKCTPESSTRTEKNLAPLEHIGSPAEHGYTDQQPININSLSSVHEVSSHLPKENQPLDALRFRANIWIANSIAYEEETWKRVRVRPRATTTTRPSDAAPVFSIVCRTSRCTMPNVNLGTGAFDADLPAEGRKKGKPQPSTTLVQQRTVETGNPSALGYLGMHCVPEDKSLKVAEESDWGPYIEVGDELEVLETGEHLYGSTGMDY